MAKERVLDIFALMSQLDVKDYDAWDNLTDEQRKELSPYMLLRWLSGTKDERQLVFLNELVNPLVFSLGDHKELLLKLLTVCTDGQRKRYTWRNFKSGKKLSSKALQLLKEHYSYGDREAKDALPLLTPGDLLELAELQGWQKEDITALKKEVGT